MDKLNNYIRINQAKSSQPEEYKKVSKKINILYSNNKLSILKIIKIYLKLNKELKIIPIASNNPIKILLIGELYTLMDNRANNDLESLLMQNKTVIYRYTDLTYLLIKKRFMQRHILNASRKYLKYTLGADGAESVYHSIKHCQEGIDGIIHIKSYGCVPELNAIPILNQISEDYKVPIMYLSYDGENNIANIDTKIEAFYDMIKSKKSKQ